MILIDISLWEIFQVCLKWKDWWSLYCTIQVYAATIGFEVTLSHLIHVRRSCHHRLVWNRSEEQKKCILGKLYLCKDSKWEMKIRSADNDTKSVDSGISERKYKSSPLIKDGINVIVSKTDLQLTVECRPSWL